MEKRWLMIFGKEKKLDSWTKHTILKFILQLDKCVGCLRWRTGFLPHPLDPYIEQELFLSTVYPIFGKNHCDYPVCCHCKEILCRREKENCSLWEKSCSLPELLACADPRYSLPPYRCCKLLAPPEPIFLS